VIDTAGATNSEPSADEFAKMIAPSAKAAQKSDEQVKVDKAFAERLELMAKLAEVPLPNTDDPKQFLTAVMNHPGVDGRLRIDAAKTLLPFTHAKLAEQGKKVERANAAKEAGAGKFAAAQPPKLALVGGR
jgi:phage terminase small subunit